jgi:hypothetical protein
LGRFISVDPIMNLADPQQMHGYAYSNNNPTTLSDPSGLLSVWDDSKDDGSGGCPGCQNGVNPVTGQSSGGGGAPVSSPSRQNGPPPVQVVGYGPDGIAGARNTAHDLIVEMERLGWHARYTQTNVSMAAQDRANVGRYVNVPGIIIGIEFSLPPTCVNPVSDVPTISNDSYTREERAAYEAANPDIPEPRDRTAREFLADITGVSAVMECASTLGCLGAAAMMVPLPINRIGSVAATAARTANVVETSRALWQLTKSGSVAMKRGGPFGTTFHKSASDGTWWTPDRAGHGGSAFKVYEETKKGLQWIRDADKYGDYIDGKWKGDTGYLIPWSDLGGAG